MPPRRARNQSRRGREGSGSLSLHVSMNVQPRVAARACVPFPVVSNLIYRHDSRLPRAALMQDPISGRSSLWSKSPPWGDAGWVDGICPCQWLKHMEEFRGGCAGSLREPCGRVEARCRRSPAPLQRWPHHSPPSETVGSLMSAAETTRGVKSCSREMLPWCWMPLDPVTWWLSSTDSWAGDAGSCLQLPSAPSWDLPSPSCWGSAVLPLTPGPAAEGMQHSVLCRRACCVGRGWLEEKGNH